MSEPVQHWEVFGYDTRQLGVHFRNAWRELLWGQESPVRRRLDEPVELALPDGASCYYQGGMLSPVDEASCEAVLLPAETVLSRELSFPRAVEDDLANVMALEVRAYSPFPEDDTAFGWSVLARDETSLQVQLVIASRASAMSFLGREYDIHDPLETEVWAEAGGRMITLTGFGEGRREQLYRKRLVRVGLRLAAIVVLLLSLAGAATALKQVELRRVQAMAAVTENKSSEASAMRSALVSANESVAAVNAILSAYPNPHLEIARLSGLLDDGVFVERFEMTGTTLNLRGRAQDAAAVMKRLIDEPSYVEVDAPRAISRVRGTDLEQFYLQVTLSGEIQ